MNGKKGHDTDERPKTKRTTKTVDHTTTRKIRHGHQRQVKTKDKTRPKTRQAKTQDKTRLKTSLEKTRQEWTKDKAKQKKGKARQDKTR